MTEKDNICIVRRMADTLNDQGVPAANIIKAVVLRLLALDVPEVATVAKEIMQKISADNFVQIIEEL